MSQRREQELQNQAGSDRAVYNFWSSPVDMNPEAPVPTPPSTNNSNGASPDHGQFRVVRKRNRVPLSCAPCRHRKLKCNRGHPCDNCTKRGDTGSCTYAAPSARKKAGQQAGPNGTPDDMQNRIDRLESLVLSLMTTEQGASTASAQASIESSRQPTSTSHSRSADVSMAQDESEMFDQEGEDSDDVNDVSQGIGFMKVDGTKSLYASDAHWHAILANIAEVKNYYANHKEDYMAHVRRVKASEDDDAPGGSLIFSAPRLNSRQEVLAAFPSKAQADSLIAEWFNSSSPFRHVSHLPTFQKNYEAFWQNQNDTPLFFIAQLYAIMALTLQVYHRSGDEPPGYVGISNKVATAYRRLTAQTIILADINDPDPLSLEALYMHFCAEVGRSRDPETSVMTLLNLIVRKAMKMGFHRDPGPHPSITPFQAEMRRRMWGYLRMTDLLYSAQAGLPPVANSQVIDAALPRNLRDEDLFEDMQTLPTARPEHEVTPVSYLINKMSLVHVFGLIIERLSVVSPMIGYEEVMSLDARLRQARNSMAPQYRLRPLKDSGDDSPNVIMHRYALELMYLMSQCLLHRRFLSRGRESSRYAHSRRTCLDASMDMLSHQALLHRESQPGGRLQSVKWYVSTLTTTDFLIAAMIVCLELHHSVESERSGHRGSTASSPSTSALAEDRKAEMLDALRHTKAIWDSLRDRSVDAWKASNSIKIMLEKLENPSQTPESGGMPTGHQYPATRFPAGIFQGNGWRGILSNGGAPMNGIDRDQGDEQAAAMTLGLLSSGGVSPGPQQLGGQANISPSSGNAGYPSNMNLLNEPAPDGGQQRTGFSPMYSGVPQDLASPFSNFQVASGGPGIFEGANGFDVDWGAWDNFIQGSSLPNHMWPSMADPSPVDPALEATAPPPPAKKAIQGDFIFGGVPYSGP